MLIVTQDALDAHLATDPIAARLDAVSRGEDEELTCQRWLRQTPAKRYIAHMLYGDLLAEGRRLRVLDVGGGLTALTRELARRHDYTLLDLLAHDSAAAADAMEAEAGRAFITRADWFAADAEGPFDVVVANDLFPNVDQRLELFLERFMPLAKQLRVSLTYYNAPRFYVTRRLDADEVLCMLAWNGTMTRAVLDRWKHTVSDYDHEVFSGERASVFANGRQVVLAALTGMVQGAQGWPNPLGIGH